MQRHSWIGVRFVGLTILILLTGVFTEPAQSTDAYYVVNSTGDTSDANPGNLVCADSFGLCTLRAAIEEINASGYADEIVISSMPIKTFSINSPLFINRDLTITGLGKDVTTIQYNGIPNYDDGLIVFANLTLDYLTVRNFTNALLINTAGLSIAINDSRLSDNEIALVLSQDSTVNITQSIIEDNNAGTHAIFNSGGQITLVSSQVIDNHSLSCGAINISGSNSRLSVLNSTIARNESNQHGGGICNIGGTINLTDSIVSSNSAVSNGGGIYQNGGELYISGNSQITSNAALLGGGIYSSLGSVFIQSVLTFMPQISDNSAVRAGGGLHLSGDGEFDLRGVLVQNNLVDNSGHTGSSHGGGIFYMQENLQRALTISDSVITDNQAVAGNGGGISVGGTTAFLFINNTTISGNQSTVSGGGIFASKGIIHLSNLTITNNTCNSDSVGSGQGGGIFQLSPAVVTFRNTIIAGNHDLKSYLLDFYSPDIDGLLVSDGYNLIGNINDWVTITGDLTGNITDLDARLDPLSVDVFAPQPFRPHHPLQTTSPAVNGGNPNGCRDHLGYVLLFDKLGYPRNRMDRCDIGAVESAHLPSIILINLAASPTTLTSGQSILATVTLNQMAQSGGTTVQLSSDKPQATLPANVTIPGGSYSQTFVIQTSTVSEDTLVTISATLDSTTRSIVLLLRPQDAQPALVGLALSTDSITGGDSLNATVTLDRVAPPGGVTVDLSSDQGAVSLPAAVIVPQGASSYTFNVQTSTVALDTLAVLSASLDSIIKTTTLILQPEQSWSIYLPMLAR